MGNGHITELLDAVHNGDERAAGELFEATYAELRRLAASAMRGQRSRHTLHPTALVHEAVLKVLAGNSLTKTRNRAMFFALAARAMRSVLVDHARRCIHAQCARARAIPATDVPRRSGSEKIV